MQHKVVGIDLGTTYSAVASWDVDTGTAEVIRDESGSRTTPSVIGLDPVSRRVIVGEVAKRNGPADPLNTVVEIKREMGELFTPETVAKYRAPEGSVGKPVKALFDGNWLLPQELSAFTLMRLKGIAERSIGDEIRDAVLTVPAYFAANQRKATEEAAMLAGLYPRELIAEPTAAAICYGVDTFDPQRHIYLVYDLGGGTFDVSIIEVEEARIQVVATSGDRRLGGGDFDDLIAHWALGQARAQGLDLTGDPLAHARVKFDAEQAKIRLSSAPETQLLVTDPRTGRSTVLNLTRALFEEMIAPLLNRSLSSVVQAIGYAKEKGVEREAIDAILLVGGSTKIPQVRSVLLDYFRKDEDFVRADANPDLLVARGAAMLAHKFEASPAPFDIRTRPSATLVNPEAQAGIEVTMITEHTLGVGIQEGLFDPLIRRCTPIPIKVTKHYTNPHMAREVVAPICQGESQRSEENTLISMMRLGPMQPLEQGKHDFEVAFSLDRNGILSVTINHVNENRTYAGEFHASTLGGDEALVARREALLRVFQPVPVGYTPPPPPVSYEQAAAVPSAAAANAPSPAAAPAPEQTAGAPASPSPAPPSATAAEPERTLPPGLLVELAAEVDDQSKSILRLARKQLLRRFDMALVEAYNALVTAANAGKSAAELEALGEQLETAYANARRTT